MLAVFYETSSFIRARGLYIYLGQNIYTRTRRGPSGGYENRRSSSAAFRICQIERNLRSKRRFGNRERNLKNEKKNTKANPFLKFDKPFGSVLARDDIRPNDNITGTISRMHMCTTRGNF